MCLVSPRTPSPCRSGGGTRHRPSSACLRSSRVHLQLLSSLPSPHPAKCLPLIVSDVGARRVHKPPATRRNWNSGVGTRPACSLDPCPPVHLAYVPSYPLSGSKHDKPSQSLESYMWQIVRGCARCRDARLSGSSPHRSWVLLPPSIRCASRVCTRLSDLTVRPVGSGNAPSISFNFVRRSRARDDDPHTCALTSGHRVSSSSGSICRFSVPAPACSPRTATRLFLPVCSRPAQTWGSSCVRGIFAKFDLGLVTAHGYASTSTAARIH